MIINSVTSGGASGSLRINQSSSEIGEVQLPAVFLGGQRMQSYGNNYILPCPVQDASVGRLNCAPVWVNGHFRYIGPTCNYLLDDGLWAANGATAGMASGSTSTFGAQSIPVVLDGIIYFLVPSSNATATLFYKYDESNNTWTALSAPFTGSNLYWTSLIIGNGVLYAFQGGNSAGFKKYNPSNNTWTNLAATPNPSAVQGSSKVGATFYNGNLYALFGGGKLFSRYNISANSWTSLAAPITYATAVEANADHVFVSNNKIIAYQGGSSLMQWIYDVANNSWTQTIPLYY